MNIDINRMTEAQVKRMEIVANELARRNNFIGLAIRKGMAGKTPEQRRAVLVMAFSQAYEALMGLQMALNSEIKPDSIELVFDAQRRRKDG